MRQRIGPKKVARYRKMTGLPVMAAMVRGGTDHRIDLLLEGGTIMHWFPKTGEMEEGRLRWKMPEDAS